LVFGARQISFSDISLSKAAHLAGLCFEEMKDLLLIRGIKIDLGPDSKEDIESEAEIIGWNFWIF
jgi:predicted HTH domain antitoxin